MLPCYRVRAQIVDLLGRIDSFVDAIYVVDDHCPEESGKLVRDSVTDPRVRVLFNETNLGVGGAVKRGFDAALADGFDILVKLDGDGQMDPDAIAQIVRPIADGHADYVKANRFYNPRYLRGMPTARLLGNGVLSFISKLSTGYWNIMDPTNGFVAIHAKVYSALERDKIDNRYFFESDMLFRLHIVGAVVQDVPLPAKYEDEKSSLVIRRIIGPFFKNHCTRFFQRVIYDYFVRDFNVGSVQLVAGMVSLTFGLTYGSIKWLNGIETNIPTETGAVMIAVIPVIIGFQLLLSALHFDISNRFTTPIQKLL